MKIEALLFLVQHQKLSRSIVFKRLVHVVDPKLTVASTNQDVSIWFPFGVVRQLLEKSYLVATFPDAYIFIEATSHETILGKESDLMEHFALICEMLTLNF